MNAYMETISVSFLPAQILFLYGRFICILWLREIEISQRVEVAAETSNMCDRIEKNIESSDRIDQVSEFEVRFSRFKLLASSSSTRPFKRL